MRRGGAPSAGVVLKRGGADHDSAKEFFRSLSSRYNTDPNMG